MCFVSPKDSSPKSNSGDDIKETQETYNAWKYWRLSLILDYT